MTIDLYKDTQPVEDTIPLYEEKAPNLRPEVTTQRAGKAAIGTGFDPETVTANLAAGNEEIMRDLAVQQKQMALRQEKARMLDQMVQENEGQVTPEIAQFVMGLSEDELINPDTIFETEYAKEFFGQTLTLANDSALKDALDEAPEEAFQSVEAAQGMLIKKESFQRTLENIEAQYEEMGLLGKGWEIIETWIPFVSWLNVHNAIDKEDVAVSWLPGTNRRQQIDYILLQEPEEAIELGNRAIAEIAEDNLLDAMTFAAQLLVRSNSDETWDNMFALLDVADVATLGVVGAAAKGIAKGGTKSVGRLRGVLRETYKAGARRTTEPTDVVAATGDFKTAATINTLSRWTKTFRANDSTLTAGDMIKQLPSIFAPKKMLRGNSRLGDTFIQRVQSNLETSASKFIQAVTEPGQVSRQSQKALQVGIEETFKRLRQRYTHLQDAVLDTSPITYRDNNANVDGVRLHIGKTDGQLFDSQEQAAITGLERYNLRGDSFRVRPMNEKFVITIDKPIDEILGTVRDFQATGENVTPRSVANTLLGWARTPDDLLSSLNLENRKAAVHSAQEVLSLAGEAAKVISKLPNRSKKALDNVLKEGRDIERDVPKASGGVKKERGMWFDNLSDLEDVWHRLNDVYPTEKEVEAYYAAQQLNDFAYMIMNLGVYRDKVRQGIELFTLPFKSVNELGETKVKNVDMEAKEIDSLPWDNPEDAGIAIYNNDTGKASYLRKNTMLQESREYLDGLLKDGNYKVLQIANPIEKRVNGDIGVNDTINFIVVRDFQAGPLSVSQIPYRAGGAVQYVDTHYIKQAMLEDTSYGTKAYQGDVSIISASSEEKAIREAERIDTARKLLKAEKESQPAAPVATPAPQAPVPTARKKPTGKELEDLEYSFEKIEEELSDLKIERQSLLDYDSENVDALKDVDSRISAKEKEFQKVKEALQGGPAEPSASPEVKIEEVSGPVRTRKDGSHVHASYNRETNTIKLNREGLRQAFKDKVWTKPKVEGVKALPEDAFKTEDEWIEFVTQHEIAHSKNPRKKGESLADYENRINDIADGEMALGNVMNKAQGTPTSPSPSPSPSVSSSAADDYIKTNLPWSPEEFRKFFKDVIDEATGEIKRKAKLHLDHPIRVVRTQQGLNDVIKDELRAQYPNLEDNWDSTYNLYRDINKSHTGERDLNLPSIAEEGTEQQPLYTLKEPRLANPLRTLTDTAASFIRSRSMADYDFFVIESFVQEFGHLMESPRGIDGLRENPMVALKRPQWKNNVDAQELAAAKAARMSIMNLLGSPSVVGQKVDWMKNKLASMAYSRYGAKAGDWVADRMLYTKTSDPFSWSRNIAFHLKLGLFNPVQLFLQAQSLTHILALSPQHATQSFIGGLFMRRMMSYGHDAIPDHMAQMARSWGWTPEDFTESFNELRKTGVWRVEGEQAYRDDMFEPKLLKGKWGTFLDAGTVFFKESERMVRFTAWNAAYREWRKANPGVTIGNRERNQILRRQNLLAVNMVRDSNAAWQQGIFSVPTQFFAYQARLAEQFLGKRLTKGEKARALAVYSAMYGVPTAAGAGIGIWPIYDTIKKGLLERGVDVDDPMLETVMDGIPAMLLEMLTGEDFNVSERYGPGGLDFLKDIATGESGIPEVLVGASGSILSDVLESFDPTLKFISGIFSEDSDRYPVTMQDFIDASRSISTVNNFAKMVYSLNTGLYVTKNEIIMDEVNSWDSVFMGITGMTPQEISDTFLMIESNQALKSVQDDAKKDIIKYIRRGLQSNSREEMETYFIKARAHLIGAGFRPDQYSEILSEALNGHTSLVDKIHKEFFLDRVPLDQVEQRAEEFHRRAREGQ